MRTLAFLALCLLLSGCAALDAPPPLSGAEIVELARAGRTAPEIIAELQRTGTVLALGASDIVALHEAGVPEEVLDYLQTVQIDALLWQERSRWWYGYGGGAFGGWTYTGPRRVRGKR
ncbi:MAG: hypothetical protein IT513_02040 [Burkholderiales bacterium]|nr:hypothetical protein [Burkholderiales bacterium]